MFTVYLWSATSDESQENYGNELFLKHTVGLCLLLTVDMENRLTMHLSTMQLKIQPTWNKNGKWSPLHLTDNQPAWRGFIS